MATQLNVLFLFAVIAIMSAIPSIADAYYQYPVRQLSPLPVPSQNFYQSPSYAPIQPLPTRRVEPMLPIVQPYSSPTPIRPLTGIQPYTYQSYNPYQLSPYSPYAGSNVADYVQGVRRPYFFSY